MAFRCIFLSLRRSSTPTSSALARSFASATEAVDDAGNSPISPGESEKSLGTEEGDNEDDDLKSRILRLRLPKRSATNVLDKWIGEGRQVTLSDLRQVSRELRRSHRYKHALEISEWMVTRDGYELSDSDYAVRIDLMTKVFGIDAAERYFEGLPPPAKTSETFTALLHSYAGSKLIDKAEELYEKMKDAKLSLNAITYNELMTMYMSVGQVEKVNSIVEEMKDQNVALDLFTYNLWISSYAASLKIDEMRRILDEMRLNPSDESWVRYVNLANIYITAGHLVSSGSNSLVESEKGITQREWITYDFLVILYGGLGDKGKLDQIWKSLRMTKQKMTSRNYACILSSYLMLGNMKEVREIIDQWKQSTATNFDSSGCSRLLEAYSGIGMSEKAANLHMLMVEKRCER